MEKITIKKIGPFTDTECPNGQKEYNISGAEKIVMAGSGTCRRCKYYTFLPLAGADTFGCTFKS